MVTLTASREREARDAARVPLYGAIAAAGLAAFLLAGDFPSHYPWLIPGLVLIVNLALALGLHQSLARWSRRQQEQFDALMDQVELLARDAASAQNAPLAEGARAPVRLMSPDGPPPEDAAVAARKRTRA